MKNRRAIVEILEARIAPAAVLTYRDASGNNATITTSKGTNADLAAAVVIAAGDLETLNLSNPVFAAANVLITGKAQPGVGDGFVDVGEIYASGQALGNVTVHGDLGSFGAGSGTGVGAKSLNVQSLGALGTFTGALNNSTSIGGSLGALNVKTDVVGASVSVFGSIGSITIGGSLIAGSDNFTGFIQSTGNIGPVKIGGDVIGGPGEVSGAINCGGTLAGVSIGGSLVGGAGTASGSIVSALSMGPVRIGHDVRGGSVTEAGFIAAGFELGTGIYGLGPGGTLAGVTIGGSLVGGGATGAGFITTENGNIGPVKVMGSIIAGQSAEAGGISSTGALASLTVGQNIIGTETNRVMIEAEGPAVHSAKSDVAIGGVSVGGDVMFANIEAGYASGTAANGAAQIGVVHVRGDWTASNLVAGVKNTAGPVNTNFGDQYDEVISTGTILSRIASVIIGGEVQGTLSSVSSTDHFGFVADKIGYFNIGGTVIAPTTFYPVGLTGDVFIHELDS
jgi:hypothetical protein